MDILKKIAQILWNFLLLLYQQLKKLLRWWIAKIKNSNSRKGSIAWLFGGLVGICFFCSILFSFTPAGRESVANSQATGTAVAIAEATSDKATQNAPTKTPLPPATNTPNPTDTPIALAESRTETIEISTPTEEPVDEPEPTATPLVAAISVQVAQANVRSGPGTEYPVIQVLTEDDILIATGFNNSRTWVQIELPNGEPGWIGTNLVEIENPEVITVVANIPPAPVQTVSVQQPPTSGGNDGGSSGNSENPFQCVGGCATAPDPSCAIKGNVNSSGERIYHVPGGAFYNRTDIKPEEGDRWFCTEAEAQAAGFRRSER